MHACVWKSEDFDPLVRDDGLSRGGGDKERVRERMKEGQSLETKLSKVFVLFDMISSAWLSSFVPCWSLLVVTESAWMVLF